MLDQLLSKSQKNVEVKVFTFDQFLQEFISVNKGPATTVKAWTQVGSLNSRLTADMKRAFLDQITPVLAPLADIHFLPRLGQIFGLFTDKDTDFWQRLVLSVEEYGLESAARYRMDVAATKVKGVNIC